MVVKGFGGENMLTDETKVHLEATLAHLEGKRDAIFQEVKNGQSKLRELDYTIATISKEIGRVPQQLPESPSNPIQIVAVPDVSRKYARISVRWAILHLLSEKPPMATSDIADALKACGVVTRAANFTNNVSAVLTTTMKGHGEVEMVDGKWQLTDRGRRAIDHIQAGPKFKESCPWAVASATTTSGTLGQTERRA
jgi:hypothetical protein